MIFSSPRFLIFLCVTLRLALPLGHEFKKRLLLVASCVFYAAWDYRYLALLFAVSVIDYACAARIVATRGPAPPARVGRRERRLESRRSSATSSTTTSSSAT